MALLASTANVCPCAPPVQCGTGAPYRSPARWKTPPQKTPYNHDPLHRYPGRRTTVERPRSAHTLRGVKGLCPTSRAQVFLKFENLQFTASFKERGACNKLSQLTPEQSARGVIAMSAGNHAQGVAYHAQRPGLACRHRHAALTPGVKVERMRGFGAEVILHGDTLEEAPRTLLRWPSNAS